MKTQAVSNQNFNGQVVYVTKDGKKYVKDITRRLPSSYEEFRRHLQPVLNKEPFDVFISRGKTPLDFNVWAGIDSLRTNTRTVKLHPTPDRIYSSSAYYTNADSFEKTLYTAVKDFKNGKFQQ